MLYFKIMEAKSEALKKKGFYPRSVMTEQVGLDVLSERIQRNCTAKKSDCLAVLTELVEVMKDELQNSHSVKIDGFGTFRIGISSKLSEKKEDVAKNIKGFRINFYPDYTVDKGTGRQKQFLQGLKARLLADDPSETTPGGETPPAGGNEGEDTDENV